jgi:hypothetical protein
MTHHHKITIHQVFVICQVLVHVSHLLSILIILIIFCYVPIILIYILCFPFWPQRKRKRREKTCYNLEISCCLVCETSSFRKILPAADLGIALVKPTLLTFLYGATWNLYSYINPQNVLWWLPADTDAIICNSRKRIRKIWISLLVIRIGVIIVVIKCDCYPLSTY